MPARPHVGPGAANPLLAAARDLDPLLCRESDPLQALSDANTLDDQAAADVSTVLRDSCTGASAAALSTIAQLPAAPLDESHWSEWYDEHGVLFNH